VFINVGKQLETGAQEMKVESGLMGIQITSRYGNWRDRAAFKTKSIV
jgi:hypothetical protein